jgi:uncharacterized protein YlaN (UPF0358 family)
LVRRELCEFVEAGGAATEEQRERFMFKLVTSGDNRQCPQVVKLMQEMLPNVGPDRCVAYHQLHDTSFYAISRERISGK